MFATVLLTKKNKENIKHKPSSSKSNVLGEDVPAEPCLSLVHVSASQTDVGAGVRRHWSPSRDLERVAASLAPTFGLRKWK